MHQMRDYHVFPFQKTSLTLTTNKIHLTSNLLVVGAPGTYPIKIWIDDI